MCTRGGIAVQDACKEIEIELKSVDISYNSNKVLEISHLRLKGPALVQVLGPNGAGKTTLLKTILGLVAPRRGCIYICGHDTTGKPDKAGRYIGYVPQIITASSHFPVTPWEIVEYEVVARRRGKLLSRRRQDVDHLVEASLKAVGLPPDTWVRPLRSLSGGQRQRAFIARALVNDPPILLMDEPLSAVDPGGRVELAELIASLARSRLAIVTSHDPMLLLEHTDLIVLIDRRLVAVGEPHTVLREDILTEVYGAAILHVKDHIHISDEHGAGYH